MVVVPDGWFMMGSENSNSLGWPQERPAHLVRFSKPFAVGVYEITIDEWGTCEAAGMCKSGSRGMDGRNGITFQAMAGGDKGSGSGRRPAHYVNKQDAHDYVRWLSDKTGENYRLLSEAEWEYVARAGSNTPYWWGDDDTNEMVGHFYFKLPLHAEDAEVGSYMANPFSLHDVAGNVYEMVEDCWHENYIGAPMDGSAWTTGCLTSYTGVKRSSTRVGSGNSTRSRYRRHWDIRQNRGAHTGFRIARDLCDSPSGTCGAAAQSISSSAGNNNQSSDKWCPNQWIRNHGQAVGVSTNDRDYELRNLIDSPHAMDLIEIAGNAREKFSSLCRQINKYCRNVYGWDGQRATCDHIDERGVMAACCVDNP
jgi:formylglycine-generating enzyme required for sulfatase activity